MMIINFGTNSAGTVTDIIGHNSINLGALTERRGQKAYSNEVEAKIRMRGTIVHHMTIKNSGNTQNTNKGFLRDLLLPQRCTGHAGEEHIGSLYVADVGVCTVVLSHIVDWNCK